MATCDVMAPIREGETPWGEILSFAHRISLPNYIGVMEPLGLFPIMGAPRIIQEKPEP